jgi:hypothetical protein
MEDTAGIVVLSEFRDMDLMGYSHIMRDVENRDVLTQLRSGHTAGTAGGSLMIIDEFPSLSHFERFRKTWESILNDHDIDPPEPRVYSVVYSVATESEVL